MRLYYLQANPSLAGKDCCNPQIYADVRIDEESALDRLLAPILFGGLPLPSYKNHDH